MRFENVSIVGVSHLDAPHQITSDFIMEKLGAALQRFGIKKNIFEVLAGVKSRYFWDKEVKPSDAATDVAKKVLETTGIAKDKIGVIINTSVSRDYIEPSTACIVHGNLGLSTECINFDLGNACLAFIDGMNVASSMIEKGQIDYALIVNAENARFIYEKTIERLLDPKADGNTFRMNFATLTLGSGAAAMILARKDLVPEGHQYLGGVTLSATQYNDLCRGNVDGMFTDTRMLLTAGIDLAKQTFAKAVQELGWKISDLSQFVIHQVSKTHTESFIRSFGIDPEKVRTIFQEFGNMGPASVPTVLSKLAEDGSLKKGDRVALMGIGSGINCSMNEIVW